MAKTTRKFVDYDGLKFYDSLLKTRTSNEIEASSQIIDNKIDTLAVCSDGDNGKVLSGGIVKEYVDGILASSIIKKTVYYVLDEDGNRIPIYDEAKGEAVSTETYYTREGLGTTSDPYVYIVADPQPEEGTDLESGVYYRTGEFETSFVETDDPVIDEETGEPLEEDANLIDGDGTISDPEIRDLFF